MPIMRASTWNTNDLNKTQNYLQNYRPASPEDRTRGGPKSEMIEDVEKEYK